MSYLVGVPGAAKPGIHVTLSARAGELDAGLETNAAATHPTAIATGRTRFNPSAVNTVSSQSRYQRDYKGRLHTRPPLSPVEAVLAAMLVVS